MVKAVNHGRLLLLLALAATCVPFTSRHLSND